MAQDLLVHVVIKHFCQKVNKMQNLKKISFLICLIIILAAGCGKVVSTQITVGEEILAADKMDEGSKNICKISARGDTDIDYLWIVDDQTVGTFVCSDSESTEFMAKDIDQDTTVEIKVIVSSPHNDDVIRTKQITVVDIPKPKPDNKNGFDMPIKPLISKPSVNVIPDKRDSSIADIQEESKEIQELYDEDADDITLEPSDIGGYTSIVIYNCGCFDGFEDAMNPSILDERGNVVYGNNLEEGEFTDEMMDIWLNDGLIKYCHSTVEAENHKLLGGKPLFIEAIGVKGVEKDDKLTLIRDVVISNADAEKIRNISKDSAIFREFRVIFVKSCDKDYKPPKIQYTGIIVDTRGLDISICAKPNILKPNKNLFYGEWGASELSIEQRSYLEAEGSVKYCYSMPEARREPRVAGCPLTVKADRAIEEDGMNKHVVLSNEAAFRINELINLTFLLNNFKVVLLIDGPSPETGEPEDDSEE